MTEATKKQVKAVQIKYVGEGSAVTNRHLIAKDEAKKGVVLPRNLDWTGENNRTILLPADDLHETAREFFEKGPHADEFQLKEFDVPSDFFNQD